jgi:hypothetical protein
MAEMEDSRQEPAVNVEMTVTVSQGVFYGQPVLAYAQKIAADRAIASSHASHKDAKSGQ